jgi:hypothetical protein
LAVPIPPWHWQETNAFGTTAKTLFTDADNGLLSSRAATEKVVKILVVQGASMAYLGKRQPESCGSTTAAELDDIMYKHAACRGYTLEIFYTHIEGEAIGHLQGNG